MSKQQKVTGGQCWALLVVLGLASCSPSVKMAIPAAFKAEATQMRVKGLSRWPINERISFGNYKSSRIRRGLPESYSQPSGSPQQRQLEDILDRQFNVDIEQSDNWEKKRFQFELNDDSLRADVYAQEEKESSGLNIRTNTIFDELARPNEYRYTFNAAIFPSQVAEEDRWRLMLTNVYDRQKDTARHPFDRPYVDENGLATNGSDTIAIRSLYLSKVQHNQGRNINMPVQVLTGYELTWDGGLVCIIDAFGGNVWLHNELDRPDKILLSAMAAAILLRRIQDISGVEKLRRLQRFKL